jgi:hypothetical protein
LIGALPLLFLLVLQAPAAERLPIIDMHLHAVPVDGVGPPPVGICSPVDPFPTWDPAQPYSTTFMKMVKEPPCKDPVWSPKTDEELMTQTIEVMAEITNQYAGIAPDDPRMEPYWALAEELDIPAGIHIGTGPPGVIYLGSTGYRARVHSALTLEEVLVRHPRLRVYIMHAGFPLLEDLLAVLYAHPQVYVDVGVIVFTQTRASFYGYLRGIVEAGFGKRVMFGSDQMVWPGVIERSIAVLEEAPFLSEAQKRDVLYHNAARFLRLSSEEVARHHGR